MGKVVFTVQVCSAQKAKVRSCTNLMFFPELYSRDPDQRCRSTTGNHSQSRHLRQHAHHQHPAKVSWSTACHDDDDEPALL